MSATGVGVRLLIDGRQVDDGCLNWAAPPPEVLPEGLWADDGLTIVWGRSDSMSQPSASSCSFRLTDTTQSSYMQSVRVGSEVRVYADAAGSGSPSLPTFVDPGFETEVRGTTANGTLTRSQRRVDTGAWAAAFAAVNPSAASSVQLPPAALEPPGGDPSAWDDLQQLRPGDTWSISARLWVPPEVTVQLRPVLYTGPFAASALTPPLILDTVTGTGNWVTMSAEFVPGANPGWLGVRFDADPGGRWVDINPSITWDAMQGTDYLWVDFLTVHIDNLNILAPAAGAGSTILVFGGRVTDLAAAYDESAQAPGIDITAADFLGDLGNRFVGDEPWPAEQLGVRMQRVLSLAAVPGEPPIASQIAPSLSTEIMGWDDVDHRAASGMLTDMAQSVDGVLWSATHVALGPYVRLENPADRPALLRLTEGPGGIISIAPIDPDALPAEQRPLEISACDILRDPVTFASDVSDTSTRVSVTWQEQTTDPDSGQPAPTDRTYTRIDAAREEQLGTRSLSLQTLLTTESAAQQVASRLLARQQGGWRATGLVVADTDFDVPDQTAAHILLTLLDGVHRGGQPIYVTELPEWSPLGTATPAYVEGGEYSYTGGGWALSLIVSPPTGLGDSAAWNELPTGWLWNEFDPGISWDDLRGVAAPLITNERGS